MNVATMGIGQTAQTSLQAFLHLSVFTCMSHFSLYFVSELPPQILTEDELTYRFTEGQKALLECESFGSPKPKVTW